VVPLDERITPFQVEITERQSFIEKALVAHHEAVSALEVWFNTELASQPGYDPEAYAPMPQGMRLVLVHLDDAAQRAAHLVASLQSELMNRFGPDIAAARQYLMDANGADGATDALAA